MSGAGTWDDVQRPDPDDDPTPMTRTELAMLWDLLGRWEASHPGYSYAGLRGLRGVVDDELAERFGG